MKWFYDLKIGTKVLAGFIIVALIAGVVGYVGIANIQEITAADVRVYTFNTEPLAFIAKASADFQRTRVNLRDICIATDMAAKTRYANEMKELSENVIHNLDLFETRIETETGRQEYDKVKAA
ncbi:MAG: MCP four helix bundle domain-containing protein, partial [Heliobacteriaceae bacterium]|nr:MCP four helix bundle domain-containing protein [Heliobacteriaceae bacterium]